MSKDANRHNKNICPRLPQNVIDFSNRRIVMIGIGSIGRATLPVLLHSFGGLTPANITVLAPDNAGYEYCKRFGVAFRYVRLVRDNIYSTLSPLLRANDFLLNLSVDVSSEALIEICQEKGALYLDTCIEPWPGMYDSPDLTPSQRSNAMLRESCLALGDKIAAASEKPMTAVVACGANPGMVSWLCKQALVNLSQDILANNEPVPTTREQWADLAQKLNIKTIHIAEADTQAPIVPKAKGEFVNTWSVDGFISEGVHQPAELSWGTHERELPSYAHFHPDLRVPNAIYLDRPGGAVEVRSWTPQVGPILGFLVTHNEAISLSQYLSKMSMQNGKLVREYCPTVHYAYQPCDAAVLSMREVFANNSVQQEKQRIPTAEELLPGGVDELGVLLMGHQKNAYWFGSQLSVDEARRIAPYNTATSLQVVGGILAGMIYAIRNPNKGIIEAEQIPHDFALKYAMPLLGPVKGYYTNWTPMQNRPHNMSQGTIADDPFQFVNFIK